MANGTSLTATSGNIVLAADLTGTLTDITCAGDFTVTIGGAVTLSGTADITGDTVMSADSFTMADTSVFNTASLDLDTVNDTVIDRLIITNDAAITVTDGSLTQNDILTIGGAFTVDSEGYAQNANITASSANINANSGAFEMANGTSLTTTSGDLAIDCDLDVTLTDVTSAGLFTVNTSGELTNSGDITTNGNTALTAASYSMTDGTALTSATGNIVINVAENVLASIMNAGGFINISSTAGAITDNLTTETSNLTAGGDISLTGYNGIGTSEDSLDIAYGGKFDAVSANGGIYVVSANSMTITSDGLTAKGDIDINVAGDITLEGAIVTDGFLTAIQTGDFITNPGTYIDATMGYTTTVGGSYTMTGDFYITSNGVVNINAADEILLTEITADSAIVLNSDNGNVLDNSAGEGDNLITLGTATITTSTGVGAAGGGDIDVSGTYNIVTQTGGIYLQSTGDLNLINAQTTSGDIVVLAAVNMNLSNLVSTLDGAVIITTGSLNQTGDILASGVGTIDVTSLSGGINMTGSTGVLGSGTITYTSAGGINAGAFTTDGTVNLTANDGAVYDAFDNEASNVTAGTLIINSSGAIGDEEGDGFDVDVANISAISENNGINLRIINGGTVIEPGIWAKNDANVFLYTDQGEISNEGIVNSASVMEAGAKIGTVGMGTVSLYEDWGSGGVAVDDDMIFYLAEKGDDSGDEDNPDNLPGDNQPGDNRQPGEGGDLLGEELFGQGASLLNEFVEGGDSLTILRNMFRDINPAQEAGDGGLLNKVQENKDNLPEQSGDIAASLGGSFVSPTVQYVNREISNTMTQFIQFYEDNGSGLFGDNQPDQMSGGNPEEFSGSSRDMLINMGYDEEMINMLYGETPERQQ